MMKNKIGIVWLWVLLLAGLQGHAQKGPNIIYIMADDLGYGDLGCYGSPHNATPHLDRLALEGTRFVQAYAAAPMCTPTRTAFVTGRYPARTPVGLREPLDWSAADSAVGITPAIPTLQGLLQQAGYRTYLLGKWHLGFGPNNSPVKNGFDYFLGYNGGGVDYVSHTDPNGQPDLYENTTRISKEGYMTDLIRDKALEIIGARHEQPFFLSVQFSAPHWPWQAPADSVYPLGNGAWKKGGSAATYTAMVQHMDKAIGAILQALEASQQASNTVVVFTSDNGGERFSDNGGLTAKKMVLYEGGIRVPAIIRWPRHIPAGQLLAQPIITMDWTATFLALAHAQPAAAAPPDGMDLMPLLTGRQAPVERTFYWRVSQRNQQQAVRQGRWKYLKTETGAFLFDLDSDAAEKNDLKASQPALFERLAQQMAAWEKTVLAPVPLHQ